MIGRKCYKKLRKVIGSEIELHLSTILKFNYYGIACNVKGFIINLGGWTTLW